LRGRSTAEEALREGNVLCGIAAGGQILVSEAMAIQLGGRFPLHQLPDVALKGKEKPMKLFEVRR